MTEPRTYSDAKKIAERLDPEALVEALKADGNPVVLRPRSPRVIATAVRPRVVSGGVHVGWDYQTRRGFAAVNADFWTPVSVRLGRDPLFVLRDGRVVGLIATDTVEVAR